MRVKSYMNNTRNLQKRNFNKTQRKYKDVTAGGTRKTKQNKTNNCNLNKRKIKKTQRKHKACSNQFGGVDPEDLDDTQNAQYIQMSANEDARNAQRHKVEECDQKVKNLLEAFRARAKIMDEDFIRQSDAIRANCDNPKKSIFSWFRQKNGP